jgi:hypothetical protein
VENIERNGYERCLSIFDVHPDVLRMIILNAPTLAEYEAQIKALEKKSKERVEKRDSKEGVSEEGNPRKPSRIGMSSPHPATSTVCDASKTFVSAEFLDLPLPPRAFIPFRLMSHRPYNGSCHDELTAEDAEESILPISDSPLINSKEWSTNPYSVYNYYLKVTGHNLKDRAFRY